MNAPLISLIVPVYKTPVVLLKRFLKNALNQTLSNIQIIAVNDASPDDCPRILDAEAAKDQRIEVFHRRTNGRAGMARNDGMRFVKGKYVLFADADDVMQPDMCETLYNLALKTHADIVACSWSITDSNGNTIDSAHLPDQQYELSSMRQRNKAYKIMNYSLWNKIFRYETISSLRFEQFDANIGEDTLFNIAALCKSRTMQTTKYCGYNYTVHTASATGRTSKGMSYLKTLVKSTERITQTILSSDKSVVGRKFSERMVLKRFTTGCGWIAEYPEPKEKSMLWNYWRHYLEEDILPNLNYYGFLASWYQLTTSFFDPRTAYRLIWYTNTICDPLSIIDKIKNRLAVR